MALTGRDVTTGPDHFIDKCRNFARFHLAFVFGHVGSSFDREAKTKRAGVARSKNDHKDLGVRAKKRPRPGRAGPRHKGANWLLIDGA